MRVDVAFLPPSHVSPSSTCLVVDVLRATSVLAVLFGRGVEAVWPAGTIEEGLSLRARLLEERGGAERIALLGERNALPPDGYDLGNSPLALEAEAAVPSLAVHATTNGTPALLACLPAALVMPAAPLNAGAVVRAAVEAAHDVLVVASGLYGRPAEDDNLACGLLVERLVRAGAQPGGDEALFALEQYEVARDDFAAALRATEHGQVLLGLGFQGDIDRCATPDVYDVAASLRLDDGRPVLRPLHPRG